MSHMRCLWHKLMLAALCRAAKLTDDNFYNNSYYAKIGGIATPELNRLELLLLKLLDFRLVVPAAELRGVLQRLQSPAPAPALPLSPCAHQVAPGCDARRSKQRVGGCGAAAVARRGAALGASAGAA